MQSKKIPSGLWPVMLTPFKQNKEIDFTALDNLTQWYIDSGVAGLFTVCGSSEMYTLTDDERIELAKRVLTKAVNKVPVVATGTFGGPIQKQAEFVKKMSDTGIAAVVCLVNQLADKNQNDDVWKANTEKLLSLTGNIELGLYECPNPYHRLLSPALLEWVISTDRFVFLKETSANIDLIKQKIAIAKNSPLSFFNAHSGSILESLQYGGNGFCGIAANFYPELFAWICKHFKDQPELAQQLQQFFIDNEKAVIEHKYMTSAKKFISLRGINIKTTCRACDHILDEKDISLLENLLKEVTIYRQKLGL
ncbi:MAG TPA: dihydrodipicolinate synthase family protein [Sedimentisphaerales bacterium]|nr:dihydrodipicolinate synthase family protein [Sedimentisphaerales bacterium]